MHVLIYVSFHDKKEKSWAADLKLKFLGGFLLRSFRIMEGVPSNESANGQQREQESRERGFAERQERLEALTEEFNRQAANLVNRIVDRIQYLSNEGEGQERKEAQSKIMMALEPLREHLEQLSALTFEEGAMPFVIVPGDEVVLPDAAVKLMGEKGGSGFEGYSMISSAPSKFPDPIKEMHLVVGVRFDPVGIRRGSIKEKVGDVEDEGRLLLTAREGVMAVVQNPELIKDQGVVFP